MSGILHRIPPMNVLPTFALPPPEQNQQPIQQQQILPAATTVEPAPTLTTAVPVPTASIPVPKSPVSYSQRFIVPAAQPNPIPSADVSKEQQPTNTSVAAEAQIADLSNSSAVLQACDE